MNKSGFQKNLKPFCGRDPESSKGREPAGEILSEAKDHCNPSQNALDTIKPPYGPTADLSDQLP